MHQIIDRYRNIVIQIATPYSQGTGFYLKGYDLIISNEHVVRDNDVVIVYGVDMPKQLTKVVFTDPKYDLAFLAAPAIKSDVNARLSQRPPDEGDAVLAVGHPFGLTFSATQGIVSSRISNKGDIRYLQHDAALNPGNSGGPLIDLEGNIIGINTFIIRDGQNIGFSLPVEYIEETLKSFTALECQEAVRCFSCENLVCDQTIQQKYCPYCGAQIELPSMVDAYEAVGIGATIEGMLSSLGYSVALSRRGPNQWEIQKGSATITIAYHEKSGLIIGDAYLCKLPKRDIERIYTYMLRRNYSLEGLSFSIKENKILLSLLLFDQYLNQETALHSFKYLFSQADDLDNILVEEYGASWLIDPNHTNEVV